MDEIIKKFPEEIVFKSQRIKAIIVKVEGVLTSTKVMTNEKNPSYTFNLLDENIIKPLRENGIVMIAVTNKESVVFKRKIEELSYDFYKSISHYKTDLISEMNSVFDVLPEEICYVGYDLNDLPYLQRCGLNACTNESVDYIKSKVNLVTQAKGGEGVLREIADLILASQNKLGKVLSQCY